MLGTIYKTGATGLAGVCLSLAGTSAHAMPTTELALGIDGSGSISGDNFELQIDAYRNVLTDPNVVPQDGSVAIGIWMFSSSTTELYPTTVIDSSTSSVSDLESDLTGVTQPNLGTDIVEVIDTASADLLTNSITSTRQIIDISTDGFGSGDTGAAADNAVSSGIEQVNCLGIGTGANCGFIAGSDAFSINADFDEDFEQALTRKIQRETNQIPAPATLALFGLGLMGVGAMGARRRKD